jgi:type IV pilus assembly protein PilE
MSFNDNGRMTRVAAMSPRPDRARGFSIIELLVALVIFAILGAIALPAYQQQMRKGARSEVKAIMLETAQYMERYYTTNKTYVGGQPLSLVSPKASTGSGIRYNISWNVTPTAGPPETYTLQAVPVNAQAADICTLLLKADGTQSSTGTGCPLSSWK